MKTFKSSGKMSAVALVLMAGAFLAPQSASADTREIRAKFSYSKSAPAEKIYSDFQHRAAFVCREVDRRPISLRLAEKRCAEDLLNKAVTKLGRADVAAVHQGEMAQIASR
jgi:hypothetical protein